jgi:serine protease
VRYSALALIGLAWVLVACPKPMPPATYFVTTVLPAPVTPGEQVTVFGALPNDSTVEFDGEQVAATAVRDGYRFTVPSSAVAGERALLLHGDGARLEASVSVAPRLDRVSLEGTTLRLEGAGWDGNSTVSVIVNALERVPSRDGAMLTVTLPDNAPFGNLSASVRVAGRDSNTLEVAREAASVTGFVRLPASAPQMARVLPRNLRDSTPSSSLLVNADPGVVSQALEVTALPVFKRWRVRFATPDIALRQLESWRARGLQVRFEQTIPASDAMTPLETNPPFAPGAGQWFLEAQGIPNAWSRSTGAGVTIAVVDTGVRLTHPDLRANLLPGFDFVGNDDAPSPTSNGEGHGTHVAGLIAAHGLVKGVAPDARILPVRVLNEQGGSESSVALGILWAANQLPERPNPNPAQVINLSLGSSAFSSLIADAVARVQAAGVIVVAAAGNDGTASVSFPAALPGVIAVTALAGPVTPYQPFYASHGAGVWVTAFGGDTTTDQDSDRRPDGILSTDHTSSGYGLRMGTSMASPQVAGLVALALSSGTPPRLARDTLARTATDLGAFGFDHRFGWGLISGRTAMPAAPRAYVLAVQNDAVRAWTLVQPDGSYRLDHLEPGQSFSILAATDADGDGVLAEIAELASFAVPFTARSKTVTALEDLTLQPSSGTRPFTLEVRP